jgi:hypothetical protein
MNSQDQDSLGMNGSGTGTNSDTPLTRERSGFDPVDIRRDLIAKRVAAGADSEIGHRCSNLVVLLKNYGQSEGKQREHIEANIRKQMTELAIRHQ